MKNKFLPNQRPIAIDLFAGCGGLSLGLEAAGFDIAVAVEFDAIHALVHHFNFIYGATICQDMAKVSTQYILDKLNSKGFTKDIDLIVGGPPCQGFSLMGKREIEDSRNQLVFEYLRVVKDIKPKYFIFENVPGIMAGKHQSFLTELVENFENIGYNVVQPYQVLDAVDYEIPQKRKRLILLGYRHDVKPINYPLKPENNSNLATVEMAIKDLAKISPYVTKDEGIKAKLLDYSGFRNSFALKPQNQFKRCHKRQNNGLIWGHLGSKHKKISQERFRETLTENTEKISRFYKLAPDGFCNTLRAGTARDKGAYTAPRPIHYQEPRCITIREAARLHTYPDWFQFHRTIWHGFREIGNSVIPFFAKILGEEIIKALDINPDHLPVYDLESIDEEVLSYNMNQASKYLEVSENFIPKRNRLKQ
jgi:DNA (cytosine-5)-methyltransferase 1